VQIILIDEIRGIVRFLPGTDHFRSQIVHEDALLLAGIDAAGKSRFALAGFVKLPLKFRQFGFVFFHGVRGFGGGQRPLQPWRG